MKKIIGYIRFKNERGVSLVLVALLLIPLIGIGALVVDLGLLYAARNELQNAADAGALAGARVLYTNDGSAINTGCNTVARNAAIANSSHGSAVEVEINEVQRGHWSFGLGSLPRGFYPNNSTSIYDDLWEYGTIDLDEDENFINAVQVITRRQNTPVGAFFSRIFNYTGFEVAATAVGYIGFAGNLEIDEVDLPIAICKQSIVKEGGGLECNIGRMLNSGSNTATSNTAGWTNFSQPCSTANTGSIQDVMQNNCVSGNPNVVILGKEVGTTGGVVDAVFDHPNQPNITDCWKNAGLGNDGYGNPANPWSVKLLVIDCPGNNVGNCSKTLGVVKVELLWIIDKGQTSGANAYGEAPYVMDNWSAATANDVTDPTNGQQRWNSFVSHFNLKNLDGQDAPYAKKSIFFKPECVFAEPTGGTGGENFGILAKIPVLVN